VIRAAGGVATDALLTRSGAATVVMMRAFYCARP